MVRLHGCHLRQDISASERPGAHFLYQNASEELCEHFSIGNISGLGLGEEYRLAACAAGALMRYLRDTQKNSLEHITGMKIYQGGETMLLDRNTRRNL